MAHIAVTELIRWSDTDLAGIMYFGNYTRLFEIGETALFSAAKMDYINTIAHEYHAWMLRVAYHCEFLSPVFLHDLVRIEIEIGKLGGASMTMNFRVLRDADNTPLGTGYCTVVMADKTTHKPKRIPDAMRVALSPYLTEDIT
jgi:acyl-CoA thioester hydrolase